ncbi:Putative uncharacterized protein ART2 [Eumeta japonica]|uniref:Uncharacterized protein n=1 Tax=Eumeta variegata TaxID=151549 RepID=A0A4C1WPJ1_EUMVA|nr:Putative uncharacterized protein ART2 [Eumeta japonica]
MVASHHRPLGRVHEPNVRNCGSSRTEQYYYRNDEPSLLPFAPREVSVLAELALGHLRYSLTDVPPQSNSPPGSVLEPDHAEFMTATRQVTRARRHSARLERNTVRPPT